MEITINGMTRQEYEELRKGIKRINYKRRLDKKPSLQWIVIPQPTKGLHLHEAKTRFLRLMKIRFLQRQ